jgi:hypothetical protein
VLFVIVQHASPPVLDWVIGNPAAIRRAAPGYNSGES